MQLVPNEVHNEKAEHVKNMQFGKLFVFVSMQIKKKTFRHFIKLEKHLIPVIRNLAFTENRVTTILVQMNE